MMKNLSFLVCFLLFFIALKAQPPQITTGLRTTWVGNTFGGGDKWIQNYVENTKVYPDGSINAKCSWDEAGRYNGIYVPCDVTGNQDVGANSRIATDAKGNTWTIVNWYGRFMNMDTIAPVPTGALAPIIQCSDGRTITSIADPTAIAVDNKGRLMVADNGTDQNIKIFDISGTPTQVATFGDQGGVFSGIPGIVSPTKLYGIRGMGTDSVGNLWVACSGWPSQQGGTDLRHYDSLGNMNCNLKGILFVESAEEDPASQSDVYTDNERTNVSYDAAPGTWGFTSETINPFKYPDDPRTAMSLETTWMRRINGQRYMFKTNMYAEFLAVYRFDGEIAVPMAMFCVGWDGQWNKYQWEITKRPQWDDNAYPTRRWMWLDKNGDGQVTPDEFSIYDIGYPYNTAISVTKNGDITLGNRTLLTFPNTGVDANGVIQYSTSTMKSMQLPQAPNLYDANHLKYVDSTDVMYIASGLTFPNFNTIYQFANWSKGGTLQKIINTPLNPGQTMTADEHYIYCTGVQNGAYTRTTGEVDIWDAGTGLPVGYILPGAEVSGQSGWNDMVYGINTFKRPDGTRVLIVEEDWKGKNIIYQWKDSWKAPAIDSLVIVSPTDSSNYTVGTPVPFALFINDGKNDSTVGHVYLYIDNVKMPDSVTYAYGQYNYSWNNATAGTHAFYAKAYDTTGHLISTSVTRHVIISYLPDLVATAIYSNPANVSSGDSVTFSVKVKNIGQGPTPAGVIIGGVFAIDGNNVTWSDTHDTALAAGDSCILIADNGALGNQYWVATAGKHTLSFLVDDINRINESNENNNLYTTSICVAGSGPAISISYPADGDTAFAGVDLNVTVDAYKCGAVLKSVTYYDNGKKLGESKTSPYSYTWKGIDTGTHVLIATAEDAENNMVSDTSVFYVRPFPKGGILHQEWDNVQGTAVSDLTTSPGYPYSPTITTIIDSVFEGPTNYALNYGARYSGYITPPQTGYYTFWIASDDNSQLWLSSNEDTTGAKLIASVSDWTNPQDWYAFPEQQSAPVYLMAGTRYYIQALHKQGSGGDNLAVGWMWPDSTYERPINASHIVPFNTPFVDSMTLTNASGNKDIRTLTGEDTVNLASLDNWLLNVRANTAPAKTGSVEFKVDGIKIRTDNLPPYTLCDGACIPVLPGRTYTITATPYALPGGQGEPGVPMTVKVRVVYSTGKGGGVGNDGFTLFPNPAGMTGNMVMADYQLPADAKVVFRIVNGNGRTVLEKEVTGHEGDNFYSLDISGLRQGVYYVDLFYGVERKTRKLLIIR